MKVSLSTEKLAIARVVPATPGGGKAFAGVLAQKNGDMFQQLENMKQGLLSGKSYSPRELLAYQVNAQSFALHLELISKCAEALNSGMKRLQSPG